jgi:hypothetical protein
MLAAAGTALIDALNEHRDIKPRIRQAGRLPQLDMDKLLKRYVSDAPTFYLLPGALRVVDASAGLAVLGFTLAGVVRNVGGHDRAFKGDGIDLGADDLLVMATRALHGQQIGNCTWNLVRAEMEDDPLFDDAGIAAITMTFESTHVELAADWALPELDSFTHFHGDIDLAPHAGDIEYQSWLATPPDFSTSRPDADLDVSLQGA